MTSLVVMTVPPADRTLPPATCDFIRISTRRQTLDHSPALPARLPYIPPVLARVQPYLLSGIDALPCEVEFDFDNISTGTKELIVGLPDAGGGDV